MEYVNIVDWVIRIILIILSVITTVFAIIQKIKAKRQAGESVKIDDITSIVIDAMTSVGNIEEQFKVISKDGVKTGCIKLPLVLNEIERECNSKNIVFNKEYWENFINTMVSVMNVQSTVQVVDDKNNKVKGVEINEN